MKLVIEQGDAPGTYDISLTPVAAPMPAPAPTPAPTPTPVVAPTLAETFGPAWPHNAALNANISPDGIFRIDGPWAGTDGDMLSLANVVMDAPNGQMLMTVPANTKAGGEILGPITQSLTKPSPYGYGYYECEMKPSAVPGVVVAFFLIQAGGSYTAFSYGPAEWDIEFLTNEFVIGKSGAVRLTIHPSNATFKLALPFDPSAAFHRYGMLWTPGQLDYTVDGAIMYTFKDPSLSQGNPMFIMANTWTGNANWGGGPPTQAATSAYKSIKFWAGATAVPN